MPVKPRTSPYCSAPVFEPLRTQIINAGALAYSIQQKVVVPCPAMTSEFVERAAMAEQLVRDAIDVMEGKSHG